MLSRVLGLTRDVLMSGFFGASLSMSAFVVAFTIPNLFRRLFGEGALSAAFVPVFVESRRREGDDRAWDLAKKVATLLAVVLIGIVVLGLAAASVLIARPQFLARISVAVGRPELIEMLTLVLPLLRIMLPYMVFICLAALCMGILNSFHHFAMPAATPAFLNVVWISAVLLLVPRFGSTPQEQIVVVAWAIVLAGVLQLVVQLPVLMRHGYRPGVSFNWTDERVGRVLKLMGPAAVGLAVTQVNVVMDRLLAAWVGHDAPAALFFSERLIYLPLGIFATAIGTVLLPVLSGHAADDATAKARETLNHSLRALLFLMIPAAVGLLVLAKPIVQMIFEWRRFTPADTDYTRLALQFYAPGLIVFSLAKIFVPAFYAQQDTKTPVRIGIYTVILNFVLNITFVLTWPQHLKHAGLACATVLSEGVYGLTLAVLLHRRLGSPGWGRITAGALRSLASAVAMGVVLAFLYPHLAEAAAAHLPAAKLSQVASVLATVLIGIASYLGCTMLLRSRELHEFVAVLRSRQER